MKTIIFTVHHCDINQTIRVTAPSVREALASLLVTPLGVGYCIEPSSYLFAGFVADLESTGAAKFGWGEYRMEDDPTPPSPEGSITFHRDLSPVEVCETFALYPWAQRFITPSGVLDRETFEGNGMWQIFNDRVGGEDLRGTLVSAHSTFGGAVAALDALTRGAQCGQWTIFQGDSCEPWQGGGCE